MRQGGDLRHGIRGGAASGRRRHLHDYGRGRQASGILAIADPVKGLLLIVLDQHDIMLRAMDALSIRAQPVARHCGRIWEYRALNVSRRLRRPIERALERKRLSARELGHAVGERNILPIVCNLICKWVLCCDPLISLDLDAWVARRSDRVVASSLMSRKTAGSIN